MVWSLLIRLGMFALTMGVLVWIGWTVPQSPDRAAEQMPDMPRIVVSEAAVSGTERPLVTPATRPTSAAPPEATVRARAEAAVDLNRATAEDLETLPGIGPVLAERIVAHRRHAGPFERVEDLRSVKGIGKKTLEKIRPMVNVTPTAIGHRERKKTA